MDQMPITRRQLTIWMLAAGSFVGIALISVGAPLWSYYVAPFAIVPVLLLFLHRLRSASPPIVEAGPSEPVARFYPPGMRELLTIEDDLPTDPYVALPDLYAGRSEPSPVYVVNRPSELDLFRAQGLRRLGVTTALVYEVKGEPVVMREAEAVPKAQGSHVAVGQKMPTTGKGSGASVLLQQAPAEQMVKTDAPQNADPMLAATLA